MTKDDSELIRHAETKIELCVRAEQKSFGLIDHYFMIFDEFEYHPGFYKSGNILPKGFSKGYHVAAIKRVCRDCLNKIILDYNLSEDRRISNWYPIFNCESLSTGISVQSIIMLVFTPTILISIVKVHFTLAIIVLLIGVLCLLFYSKWTFSRTRMLKCEHL